MIERRGILTQNINKNNNVTVLDHDTLKYVARDTTNSHFICNKHILDIYIGHYRIGEASNPGPKCKDTVLVEIANVTHFKNNANIIAKRKFKAMFMTETSVTQQQAKEARETLRNDMPKVKTHVSNLDGEKSHKVGGTGIALNDNKHIIIPEPRTRNFKDLCGEGRSWRQAE